MAKKRVRTPEEASRDPVSITLLTLANESEIETSFSRADSMAPCPIGSDGMCCKICSMGPCRLVKEGQTGSLVELGDVEAMAGRIVTLLGDGTLRQEMGQEARKWAIEKFSIEQLAKNTEAVYLEALDGKRGE